MKVYQVVLFSILSTLSKVVATDKDEALLALERVLKRGVEGECPYGSVERNYFVRFTAEVDVAEPDQIECSDSEFEQFSAIVDNTLNSVGTSGKVEDQKDGSPIVFEALKCPAPSSPGTLRGRRRLCSWGTCWPWNMSRPAPCSGCWGNNCDDDTGGDCRRLRNRDLFADEVSDLDEKSFKSKKASIERKVRGVLFEALVDEEEGVPCLSGLGRKDLFVSVVAELIPFSEFGC
uniref:Uncharacterized protein n=1 Tax=Grammatophora oceanica TaxID=210454 RepID=A0A7S1Y7I3_9STRA|mmetsp:Transcript_29622/g.43682  ORF Transcript_29622/g.43682 Transcript_29622/m.43682 type:complete len:233 (+) Transcript_29622:66-764(+)